MLNNICPKYGYETSIVRYLDPQILVLNLMEPTTKIIQVKELKGWPSYMEIHPILALDWITQFSN
jgi:hypothetical protein